MEEFDYKSASNEELLGRYKKSDEKAFIEFFSRHKELLYNYIYSRMRNRSEAEDVLQDTFFRVHKYVVRFDPDKQALGWVFQIARNAMIDAYKKRQQESAQKGEDPAHDPRGGLDAKEALVSLLAKLSAPERDLIISRFVNDESFADMAARLSTTETNVRQRFSRLLRRLRTKA